MVENKNSNKTKTIYRPLSLKIWQWGRKYAQGPLEGGKRQGFWIFWYVDGRKQMAGDYDSGVKTGLWTKWWPNGNPQSRGRFESGRMHGAWTDYFPNGEKAQVTEWDHGRPVGEVVQYDSETGGVAKRSKVPKKEQVVKDYTLLSDRDMLAALRRVQTQRINLTWKVMVGPKIGSLLEPWQAALWALLIVPVYTLIGRYVDLGYWAAPVSIFGASLVSTALVALIRIHDKFTKADYGTGPD